MNPHGRPTGTSTGPAREITPAEIAALTETAPTLRDKALIWLCLGGGLRVGEACTLTHRCVGSDGSILVERSKSKSGKSRRVYLSPQAQTHLRAYLATMPIAAPSSPLFPRPGERSCLRPSDGVRLLARLLRAANATCATSHSLRRTHANTLRRAGVDMVVIQGQLGHSSLATTAAYLSVSCTETASALEKIRF